MKGVFISYRREDGGYAGRLYDRLRERFGQEHVFMDIDAIDPGVDFVEVIEEAVGSCDALVAIIGREWLNLRDADGKRCLDDPADFVRLELAAALGRGVRVIPVLVEGALVPKPHELPEGLAPLSRRNAIELRHSRWDDDVGRLLKTLEKVMTPPPGMAEGPAGGRTFAGVPTGATAAGAEERQTAVLSTGDAGTAPRRRTGLIAGVAAAVVAVAVAIGALASGGGGEKDGDTKETVTTSPPGGEAAGQAGAGAVAPAPPLTGAALENAEYTVTDFERNNRTVRLRNGVYEEVNLFVELREFAFGDLDGDGAADAAVILGTNWGGSGVLIEVAAVINRSGAPRHLTSAGLGDRTGVEALAIEAGEIVLDLVTHGPDDPACCPTEKVTARYRLDGEHLVEAD